MRKAIDQDTLQALIETQAMREFKAVRKGDSWALHGRIGASWLPIRSRREPIRFWASLSALGNFCEKQGVKSLTVEF